MAKLLGESNAKKMTSPLALGSVKARGKPSKKESAQIHLVAKGISTRQGGSCTMYRNTALRRIRDSLSDKLRGSPHSGEVLGLLKRLVPGQGGSSEARSRGNSARLNWLRGATET